MTPKQVNSLHKELQNCIAEGHVINYYVYIVAVHSTVTLISSSRYTWIKYSKYITSACVWYI